MSTSEEVYLELLLLDGSNYASWSASVLDVFRTMGSQIERIVDVSISPPSDDLDYLSRKEVKCLQYNAQATNVLFRALSEDVLVPSYLEMVNHLMMLMSFGPRSKKNMTSLNVMRSCSHWRNHLRSAQFHQQIKSLK
jgi:hypothetical protein